MRTRCLNGHEWEDTLDSISATQVIDQVRCPICGAPADLSALAALQDGNGDQAASTKQPAEYSWGEDSVMPAPTYVVSELRPGPVETTVRPTIPGYEILDELGRGGMGVVYKARHLALNRIVAIKMVLGGGYARFAWERFRIEAEAVAQLQHPNIVQIHEVGEANGQPYFSLEFVDSGSLYHLLEDKPLPAREAAAVTETVARAIHFAHQRGIIHRDLKPANILLHRDEGSRSKDESSTRLRASGTGFLLNHVAYIPKITDFGLAKRLDVDVSQTQTGEVMGTPTYMAPEQAEGKTKELGPPVDIYALGTILYEMLTGRPPFHAESPIETLRQVVHDDPLPPTRLQPRVPADLETICLKCLEKDPRRRYASAGDLADDLARFLSGEPIAARPISTLERGLKWAKRRPALASLVGVICLSLLGLIVGSVLVALWERGHAVEADRLRQGELDAKLKAVEQREAAVKEKKEADLQRQEADRQKKRAEDEGKEAERQKGRAELQAKEADRQKGIAEEQRDEADRQQKLSEANFQMAREAVDRMLTRVADEQLVPVPQMEQVRRKLLEDAHVLYERFLKDRRDDPALWLETARALVKLGDIRKMLSLFPQARDGYLQAIALFERLEAKFPNEPAYRQELGRCQNSIGLVYRYMGKPQEARQAYNEAQKVQDRLCQEHRDSRAYRSDLAGTHNDLGNLLLELIRFDKTGAKSAQKLLVIAKDHLDAGKQLFEVLVGESAKTPDYRRGLSATHNNLGLYFQFTRDFDEANKSYQGAIQQTELLVKDHPGIPLFKQELAKNYSNLAGAAIERAEKETGDPKKNERFAEAEKSYRKALEIQEALVADFRTVPDYQSGLGAILDNLGYLYLKQSKLKEAQRQLDLAAPYHDSARKENPDHPTYRQFHRNHFILLAEVLVRMGQHEPGFKATEDFVRLVGNDPKEWYFAARFLAGCAVKAQKDDKLNADKKKQLVAQYREASLQKLKSAVQGGFTGWNLVEADEYFKELIADKDFKEKLEGLKKIEGPKQ